VISLERTGSNAFFADGWYERTPEHDATAATRRRRRAGQLDGRAEQVLIRDSRVFRFCMLLLILLHHPSFLFPIVKYLIFIDLCRREENKLEPDADDFVEI
jgi:hypothetical protein